MMACTGRLVADRDSFSSVADRGDDAGCLVTRNERWRRLDLVLAPDHEHVREIQPRGPDVDDDLAGAGDRVIDIFQDQCIGRAVVLADQCPHQATSNSDAAPCPPPMHMVHTTYFAPRRLPSMSACPTMRAPDMP